MNFCECGGLLDRGVCEVCGHDDWEEKEAKQRKKIAEIEQAIRREMWLTMPARVDHVAAACLAGARAANGWGFQGFRDGLD